MPKITFGVIVLNGEPFTRYNLRSLYPFAHEIIVVEGAVPGAVNIATPDGHSTDGTLDILKHFKACEDPKNKLIIVTAEDEGYPSGFWPGEKHEQSQAYAKRATGNYLWQVDIDEFYKGEDMQRVVEMLQSAPEITAVSFKQISFWGGFDYITDGWYLHRGGEIFHRLFKWGSGCQYVTHRPPTVHDPNGHDLRHVRWVSGHQMARQRIFLYHYPLTFPKQVLEKCAYYNEANWATHAREIDQWARSCFMTLGNPFRVHNVYAYPSWLERFKGEHPEEIVQLRKDILDKKVAVELRQTDDVERLLSSASYKLLRALLKWSVPMYLLSRDAASAAMRQAARVKIIIWRAFGKITHPTN